MRVPKPGGGVGSGGIPRVQAGVHADASAFGANTFHDLYGLGGAARGVGHTMLAEAQDRQRREDETHVRDTINQARLRYIKDSDPILAKQGRDAESAPAEMAKLLETMKGDCDKTLKNGNQRDMFERAWGSLSKDAEATAIRHRQRQMDRYEKQSLEAQNQAMAVEAARKVVEPGGIDDVLNNAYTDMIRANIDSLTPGAPPEVKDLAKNRAVATFHQAQLDALSELGPEAALEYLDRTAGDFEPAEAKKLRGGYAQAMETNARKHSEAGARRIGIELGTRFDNEGDILAALYDDDAPEVAALAKTEREALAKARRANPDSGEEEAEMAAPDYREKIAKIAISAMKTRHATEAREAVGFASRAMDSLAKAGWDVSAVSPDWPPELQARMTAVCGTMRSAAGWPAPGDKALQYCDMTPDQLRNLARDGQWPDMVMALGGPGTPEYRLVRDKINGAATGGAKPAAARTGSGAPMQTPLQFARNEFIAVTGLNPVSKKGKRSFSQYISLVNERLEERAAELGVEVRKIPREEQRKIVDDLLAKGEYDEGWLYWGKDMHRFQVAADEGKDETYFTIEGGAAMPEYAKPYFGKRDRSRDLLPDGRVRIVNQFGEARVISPDGSSQSFRPVP